MKYRLKIIIMCVTILCLTIASVTSAISYKERYYRAVIEDDPNLYLKFDSYMPMDYSNNHYAKVGYIKDVYTDQEPNDLTKVVYAGGIGSCLLLDNTLSIGSGPHQSCGAFAYNFRTVTSGQPEWASWDNKYSFGGDRFPYDLSFEFWFKAGEIGSPTEPQMNPNGISYFFQHGGKWYYPPHAPGISAIIRGDGPDYQFRVDCGSRFWYTDVNVPLDQEWHQVVVTYDEKYDDVNENAMRVEFYLDGVQEGNTVAYGNTNNVVTNYQFESGIAPWAARESCTVVQDDYFPRYGSYCAWVYDRDTATTQGMEQDMMTKLLDGYTYTFDAFGLTTSNDSGSNVINAFIEKIDDAGTVRTNISSKSFGQDDWGQFDRSYYTLYVTGTLTSLKLCFDGPAVGVEFWIDGGGVTLPMMAGYSGRMGPEYVSLTIGGGNDRGWVTDPWGGYLDEFAIYDGILTGDRVLAHYEAWQPQSCEELWERGSELESGSRWDRDGLPSGPLHWDRIKGGTVGMAADMDQDCNVDLADFAIFATEWAKCNDPAVGPPTCPANW